MFWLCIRQRFWLYVCHDQPTILAFPAPGHSVTQPSVSLQDLSRSHDLGIQDQTGSNRYLEYLCKWAAGYQIESMSPLLANRLWKCDQMIVRIWVWSPNFVIVWFFCFVLGGLFFALISILLKHCDFSEICGVLAFSVQLSVSLKQEVGLRGTS